MKIISLFIPGAAKTKGSMRHVGRGQMRESVEGSTQWKRLMAGLLHAHYRKFYSEPMAGPVSVRALVVLPVEPEKLIEQGSGDVDKLARNLLDALTDAKVYGDDAQVVVLHIVKESFRTGRPIGIEVTVQELTRP